MKNHIETTMTLELTKKEFEVIRNFLNAMDDYANKVNDDADDFMNICYYILCEHFVTLENNHNLVVKITD